MSAGSDKDNKIGFAFVIKPVNKKEIPTNMAFPVSFPLAFQWMIQPFSTERTVIGDQQQHYLFELVHVVPARTRQRFPILQKGLGVVGNSGQGGPFTCCCFFQDWQTVRQQLQSERDESAPFRQLQPLPLAFLRSAL